MAPLYDPADGLFKLWYHAGWFDGTALATSRDGVSRSGWKTTGEKLSDRIREVLLDAARAHEAIKENTHRARLR